MPDAHHFVFVITLSSPIAKNSLGVADAALSPATSEADGSCSGFGYLL